MRLYLPWEIKWQRTDHIPELILEFHSRFLAKIWNGRNTVQNSGAQAHSQWGKVMNDLSTAVTYPKPMRSWPTWNDFQAFLVNWGWGGWGLNWHFFGHCSFTKLLLKISLSLNPSPPIADWVAPGHGPSDQLPGNWPWTTYTLESSSVSPGRGHTLWSLAFYVGARNTNVGAYTFMVSIYQQSRLPVSLPFKLKPACPTVVNSLTLWTGSGRELQAFFSRIKFELWAAGKMCIDTWQWCLQLQQTDDAAELNDN